MSAERLSQIETAWTVLRSDGQHELRDNALLRLARRVLPTTDQYDGARTVTRVGGTWMVAWVPPLIAGEWAMTKSMIYCMASVDIARPLGISVHDHIIVGKHGHASLKGLKLM